MERVGITFSDRPHIKDYDACASLAERAGFDTIWVTEPRLGRDAITAMAVVAAATDRVSIGSAVVNNWTRGPGLMAQTFATLDQIAPGRVILGIGAYWDPLAWNQGIVRRKNLTAMREYVEIVRQLLNLERVTYEGEVVTVRDLELDYAHGDQLAYGNVWEQSTIDIPIYLGPTGERMLQLSGRIADGALLNAAFSPEYTKWAVEQVQKGIAESGRAADSVDLPKMIYIAVDRGPESWPSIKRKITRYLGQQPHVREFSGLEEDKLKEIGEAMGGWPPRKGGIEAAMRVVPDDTVLSLIAFGTVEECKRRIGEFMAAGATWPVLMTEQDDLEEIITEFSPSNW